MVSEGLRTKTVRTLLWGPACHFSAMGDWTDGAACSSCAMDICENCGGCDCNDGCMDGCASDFGITGDEQELERGEAD